MKDLKCMTETEIPQMYHRDRNTLTSLQWTDSNGDRLTHFLDVIPSPPMQDTLIKKLISTLSGPVNFVEVLQPTQQLPGC
jgi:hypothetical protein